MHRCRLFKFAIGGWVGTCYFEVWDTLQEPFAENDLPVGEVTAMVLAKTRVEVKERIQIIKSDMGIDTSIRWFRLRDMIIY